LELGCWRWENGFRGHGAGNFMGRFTIARHNMKVNVSTNDGAGRSVHVNDLWSLKWHQNFVQQ
jgi:hypothetical protein